MARQSLPELDPGPRLADVGHINPATRGAAIIAFRVLAGLSTVVLVTAVHPVNYGVQWAGARLHNWAGPLADRMLHQHHAGRPVTVKHLPGFLASGHNWPWVVGSAALLLVVYVGLAVTKMRRADPLAVAEGRRNVLGITAAIVVGLVVLIVLALQVDMGRTTVAYALRGLAWFGGWLQHWIAGLN